MTAIQPLEADLSIFLEQNFSQDDKHVDFFDKELLSFLTRHDEKPIDAYRLAVRLTASLIKQDALFSLTRMAASIIDYADSLDIVARLNRLYLTNPSRLLYLSKIHLACKALLSVLSLYRTRSANLAPIYMRQVEITGDDVKIVGLDRVENLSREQIGIARKAIIDWVTVTRLDEYSPFLFPMVRSEYGQNRYSMHDNLGIIASYLLLCRSGWAERLLKLNHDVNAER